MQAEDGTSLVDSITSLSPSDSILVGALIGGLLMYGYWYYKEDDRHREPFINKTQKEFKLGLYMSGIIGFFGGALLGVAAHAKGVDIESSAYVAGIGGLLSPWAFRKVANWQYAFMVRAAQHPFFANTPRAHALEYKSPQGKLSVLDKKIMGLTGDSTTPIPGESVKDWDHRREKILHRMASWFQNQVPPTKEELADIYAIFPRAPDLGAIQKEVDALGQQQTNLTLADSFKKDQLILTQSSMIEEYSQKLHEASDALEKRDKRYQPQHRYPRELAYTISGTAAGYILRWLMS